MPHAKGKGYKGMSGKEYMKETRQEMMREEKPAKKKPGKKK